ncbi:MAG TPA: hypothetical protein VNC82_23290 [Candidatus Limnocylindria bacterium]|nr:hypothetical protein [Candidatus Limnocylindria bacterium]
MRRGIPAARAALFVVAGLMLATGVAAAQADLAKALVGTWKGELQTLTKQGDPVLTLIISSVKQEGGKWVADARLGGADAAKTRPVNIDIDTSGSKPSLRFKGAAGAEYNLNLFGGKEPVGTATLTSAQAGRSTGSRDRSVKLEKKE